MMRYVIEVKHNTSGAIAGFNLNITGDLEIISTSFLVRVKEIMDTDFIGFNITSIILEEY